MLLCAQFENLKDAYGLTWKFWQYLAHIVAFYQGQDEPDESDTIPEKMKAF